MKKQDKTPVLINLVSTIRDEEGEQEAPMQLFCRGEIQENRQRLSHPLSGVHADGG